MANTTERDHIRDTEADLQGRPGQYGSLEAESSQHSEGDGLQERMPKDRECCQRPSLSAVYGEEIRNFIHLSWPIVVTSLFNAVPPLIATCFSGHLGKAELNAIALAVSFTYVSATCIAFGVSTACDTYFSQYHGSTNRHKLGVMLQKALLILTLLSLPCMAIHLNAETLLILIGQDKEEARLCGRYMLLGIPSVMAIFIYFGLIKFLMCQSILIPGLIISLSSISLDVFLHYCLVVKADLGLDGSVIAQDITYWFMVVVLAVYIRHSGILKHIWQGWSVECLEEWGGFFTLAFLGAIILTLHSWCLDVTVYLAGLLGDIELGAQGILFQLNGVSGSSLNGLGISAGIRVGNVLGAGSKEKAILAAKVSLGVGVLWGVFLAILFCGLKNYVPHIFSDDSEIVDLVSTLIPLLSLRILFMASAYIIQGQLRGCGRQALDAVIVVSGHVVSLVMGVTLMFLTSMKLMGMWTGYTCGMLVEAIIGCFILGTTDWDHQVQRALRLTKSMSPEERQNSSELQTLSADLDDGDSVPVNEGKSALLRETNDSIVELSAMTIYKRLATALTVLVILGIAVVTRISIDLYELDLDTNSTSTASPVGVSVIPF